MTKLAASIIAAFLSMALFSSAYSQPKATVTIDKIEENNMISGRVEGLDRTTAKGYHVVVYVHTNIWYIHPYAGQDEGKSWSSISGNGEWSVETVNRGFPADQVAAVVVSDAYDPPAQTPSLRSINAIGMVTKPLKKTPDYGKL
jgi:hypothetical protein